MLPQAASGGSFLQGAGGAPALQSAGGASINRSPVYTPAQAPAAAPATPASTGITTTGGAGTAATDPNAVAYYQDVVTQLTAELNAAKAQQPTGLDNINNAFNQSQNGLNQQESTAETGYNTQRGENGQQRETNLGTIAGGANSAYNSLMSLLGAAGSGVSSAARFGAPQAVSQNASQQRSQADQSFNTNDAAISSAENTTKQNYQNSLNDLLTQKNNQTEGYLSGVLGSEANLEQQIGAAKINAAEYGGKNYAAAEQGAQNETNAVNSIEGQLNDIFSKYATPTFNVTPVTASTPNLSTYTYDPTTVKAAASNPGTDSAFLPYLASLKQSQPTNGGSILTGGSGTGGAASAITAGAGK
jgi:hypothetical protein